MSFTLYSWQHNILLLLNILEYQTLERNKKIDESDKIGILEVKHDNDILIVTLKQLYILHIFVLTRSSNKSQCVNIEIS